MFTSSSNTSSTSVATTFSKAPLMPSSEKDYSAAFASLQNNFGFTGTAAPIYNPAPAPKVKRVGTRSSTSAPAPPRSSITSTKDYEAAFGTLSSSFGFVGRAPSVPQSSTKSKSIFGRSK